MKLKSELLFQLIAFVFLLNSCLTSASLQQKFGDYIQHDNITNGIGEHFYRQSDLWKCKSNEDLETLSKYTLIDVSLLTPEHKTNSEVITGFSVIYTLVSNNGTQEIVIEDYEYDRYRKNFFFADESNYFRFRYKREGTFFLSFRTERKYYLRGSNEHFSVEINIKNNRFMLGASEANIRCDIISNTKFDDNYRMYEPFVNSIGGYFVSHDSDMVFTDKITYDGIYAMQENKTGISSYLWFYGRSAAILYSTLNAFIKNNPAEIEPKNDNAKIIKFKLSIAGTEVDLTPIVFDEQLVSIHEK